MLRRVTFQMDITPTRDLFGVGMMNKLEMIDSHRTILLNALNGVASLDPPLLFEQTCWAWLYGEPWDKYPELTKEDGIWHTT